VGLETSAIETRFLVLIYCMRDQNLVTSFRRH